MSPERLVGSVDPMRKRDFSGLSASLLARAEEYLFQWFPGGQVSRGEFKIGDISGSPGKSLSVNLRTGKWSDFANPDAASGGDLVSLYAAREGISQVDAYDRLSGEPKSVIQPARRLEPEPRLELPPENAGMPAWGRAGQPSATYCYTTGGRVAFWVARHEIAGRKTFLPWSWDGSRWVSKAWPSARPLYRLAELEQKPNAPVLVVEGEKCADALAALGGPYVVTTWAGGAQATQKTDWTPLQGRRVLLWPDADEPGIRAMSRIAERLADRCSEVKTIDVSGQPEGWDAADAIQAGAQTWAAIAGWAKPRIKIYGSDGEEEEQQQEAADCKIRDRANLWEDLGLVLGSSLQPITNLDNVCKILERWSVVAGQFFKDGFSRKILTTWAGPRREWTDEDDRNLTRLIQSRLEIPKTSIEVVHDAVQLVSSQNVCNPLEDFLSACRKKWDGRYRLETWLSVVFGCEQSDYHASVGRCWLVSMVARALSPGCKVDTMPILEGGQGVGKSTALQILGGDWFSECHESITSKDFFGVLNGKWLLEISEMHSFSRGEKERIKGIISCQTDRYRVPYARNTADFPRSCVFAGTTNRGDWNNDETGARRFWPISCGAVNLTWLRETREQLFGEAVARYEAGESWWDVDRTLQDAECERRLVQDTWQEALMRELEQHRSYTVRQILTDIIQLELSKQDRRTELRVSECLKRLGWVSSVTKTPNRQSIRVWKFVP